MFLWRWFKRCVVLAILAGGAYVVGGYVDWHGKPARDRVIGFFRSTQWNEGMKDLRTWLGALLQVAGKKIEEGVTPEDQQKLDQLFVEDMQKRPADEKKEKDKPKETK